MGPSAYLADDLKKDTIVEDRSGVTATFRGGNVFHLQATGAEKPVVVRGGKKAFERAEALRLELDPKYQAPAELETVETADAKDKDKFSPPAAKPVAKEVAKAAEVAESSSKPDKPQRVEFGGVEGTLLLMLVADVHVLLADWQGRLDPLLESEEVRRMRKRVRATDGRCAPIFFTNTPDSDDLSLVDGLRTMACALTLGLERVAVVILPSDRVGDAQGAIANIGAAAIAKSDSDEEDEELVRRAYIPDDD